MNFNSKKFLRVTTRSAKNKSKSLITIDEDTFTIKKQISNKKQNVEKTDFYLNRFYGGTPIWPTGNATVDPSLVSSDLLFTLMKFSYYYIRIQVFVLLLSNAYIILYLIDFLKK